MCDVIRRIRYLLVSVVLLLSLAEAGQSQSARRLTNYVARSQETSFVSCWDEPFGSRFARSPVLTSPDGTYRAYAEVEAIAFEPFNKERYRGPLCANTTRLFVFRSTEREPRLVYFHEPTAWELGNGIRLVDWSKDGSALLLELVTWQYESEGVAKSLLLYVPEFGIFHRRDFSPIFAKRHGKDCGVHIELEGFDPDGKVILKTGPVDADEEEMGVESCVSKVGRWRFNPDDDSLVELGGNFRVQKYGKIVKAPANK